MTTDPVAELLFNGPDTPISTDPSTVMPWAAAVWSDTALHIATRPTSRKGRNLAGNPHCVLTTTTTAADTADLLVDALAALGQVDEYHLLVHPTALRSGKALFRPGPPPLNLLTVGARTFSPGGDVDDLPHVRRRGRAGVRSAGEPPWRAEHRGG